MTAAGLEAAALSRAEAAPVAALHEVSRIYRMGTNEVRALDNFTFNFRQGEYWGIMGSSGSGKSTLLNILGCIDRPTSGSYRVRDQEVADLDDDDLSELRGKAVGFVFQSFNLIQQLNVLENIMVPMFYLEEQPDSAEDIAGALAERVGLGSRLDHRPNELSGGQQQRVAIARALVNDPAILLADEATGNLDTNTAGEILTLFDELHAEGMTILLVTHEPSIGERAERILRLKDGQIDAVVERPQQRMILSGTFLRTVRLGVKSLLLHKLRSLLTTLGVLFGVSSVIAMLAIGEGASEEAQEQIRQLGSQNVILRSIKPPEDLVSNQRVRVSQYGLTDLDLERIDETFPWVNRVVPVRNLAQEVRYGERMLNPKVLATVPDYLDVTGRIMQEGRFLSPEDERRAANVCVLGYEIARALFPFESSVGKKVKIGPDYFSVVGVMLPRVPVGADRPKAGEEITGEVLIPLQTGKRWFGEIQVKIRSGSRDMEEVQLHEIIVEVEEQDDVPRAAEACREMLSRNHKQRDYEVVVPLELMLRAKETQRIFSIVLGSIAGISLLVGGIGIMNVMLATVTERTREIGIRRALGAKRRHIVVQFLVETVVLSVSGGVLGIILGVAIPFFVERYADLRTIVTPGAPLLAFGISVGIGIVFGLYPAWRAANMDPVDALRHE